MEVFASYITILALKKNWKVINAKMPELKSKIYVPGLGSQSLGVSGTADFTLRYAISPETGKWAFVINNGGHEFWTPAGNGQYVFNKGVVEKLLIQWWKVFGDQVDKSQEAFIDQLWQDPAIDEDIWPFTLSDRLRHIERTFEHHFYNCAVKLTFKGIEDMCGRFTGKISVSYDGSTCSLSVRDVMADGREVVVSDIEGLYYKQIPATVKVLLRDTIIAWAKKD